MFFLWILLSLFIIFILLNFSTVKIEIKNLKVSFPKINGKNTNEHYEISINLYLFDRIKILKSSITRSKIKKRGLNQKIKKLQKILIKNRGNFNFNIFNSIKILNFDIEKLKLKINLGTEDAAITAISTGAIAGVIGIGLKDKIKDINNIKFKVDPVYLDKNFLEVYLDGIFTIKKIHIIHIIIYMLKEKKESG